MISKNLQAIYVMWLRELKRFLRSRSRLISSLAMPFFFLFTMSFGFRTLDMPDTFEGVEYINFLTPGIIGMTILFSSMFTGLSTLWDKEFGFLKEIMVSPVRRSIIILGRIAGGITTNFIQGAIILIFSLVLGFDIISLLSFIPALFLMIVIGIGFSALSVAIASKIGNIEAFPLVMQFFTFPCFLLSGALFPITNFPKWVKYLSLINPLTYGVDGLRNVLIGFSQFSLFLDLTVLLIFGAIMIIIGSYLFGKTEV